MKLHQAFRKEFNNLKNKLHIPDLKYLVQESTTEEYIKPAYALQINGISERVAPITMYAHTEEELLEKFKKFVEKLDYDEIDIAYMKASADLHAKLAEDYLNNVKMIKNRVEFEEKQAEYNKKKAKENEK